MHEPVTLAQFNIRSLLPKFNELKDHMSLSNYSVLCLTETWIAPTIKDEVISIEGYQLVRKDRRIGRGGGVGMYIKNTFSFSLIDSESTIEQLWVKININKQHYAVGVVYRQPDLSYNEFLNTLEHQLSFLLPQYDEIFCLGDFNIDMLKTDSLGFFKLNQILEAYNLDQLVHSPTRITLKSTTLIDLIITTNNDDVVDCVNVISLDHMSDHELTCCELNIKCKSNVPIFKTIRNFKNFIQEQFYADLTSINFDVIYDLNNVNDKLNFLNENILNLLNIHAPIITIRITKKFSPWITDNLRLLISLRNKARSRWRRTKNEGHYNYYKELRNYTTLSCRREKKAFFEHKLRVNGANKVWRDLEMLNIKKSRKNTIPNDLKYADNLNKYFANSIPLMPTDQNVINYYNSNIIQNIETFTFRLISEFDVQKILYAIKTNALGHDGLNIIVLLMCCPHILPYITHILNFCLENNIFPDAWKQALILPIPKNNNPTEFKDLRPISILPTLSKVLEREVESQLREHVTKFNILPDMQSGFRPLHSCETALLNITDDILRGTDEKKATVLVLIDFSKAFDTIDHKILLAVLKFVGVSNETLNFFRSYLTGRTQRVKADNSVSAPLDVLSGVPQGSILGPLLYTLYTSEFQKSVKHCQMHLYADDTQLYLSFDPSQCLEAMDKINQDIVSLLEKSKSHSLNINATKTSVLVFGQPNVRSEVSERILINIDGHNVSPTVKAKNLGLIFDSSLRFKPHINNCIRLAYMNLKMIYSNRYYLSQKVKTILCESLVLSRFNFADTVYGPCIDADDNRRIQVVQNACLRLIFGVRRRQNISHKLPELGWLNMSGRRLLHSACLFHKIVTNKIPKYLNKKISYRTDVHNINIRFKGTLTPPLHRTEMFKRSFSYQITKVYNSVPPSIKSKTVSTYKNSYKKFLLSQRNISN